MNSLTVRIALIAFFVAVLGSIPQVHATPPSRDDRRFPQIMAATFDPNAKYFVLAEWRDWQMPRGVLRCFEFPGVKELESLPESVGYPYSISISKDGRYLAGTSFSPDGCRIWDMNTRAKIARIHEASESLDFSPDGTQIILGSPNSRIFAYNVPEWRMLGEFERTFTRTANATYSNVKSVDVSPNGKLLAGAHNGVRIWDIATRKEVQVPYSPDIGVFGLVAFSADSKLLVCMNQEGLRCWDVERQKQVWAREGLYQTFAWTPNGTRLIASSHHDGVHYIDPKNGWTRELLYPRPFWASALAFSPDGQWLVAGGQMEIRIRNLKTGKDHIIKQEPYIEK